MRSSVERTVTALIVSTNNGLEDKMLVKPVIERPIVRHWNYICDYLWLRAGSRLR